MALGTPLGLSQWKRQPQGIQGTCAQSQLFQCQLRPQAAPRAYRSISSPGGGGPPHFQIVLMLEFVLHVIQGGDRMVPIRLCSGLFIYIRYLPKPHFLNQAPGPVYPEPTQLSACCTHILGREFQDHCMFTSKLLPCPEASIPKAVSESSPEPGSQGNLASVLSKGKSPRGGPEPVRLFHARGKGERVMALESW